MLPNEKERIVSLQIPVAFSELRVRGKYRFKLYHGGRGGGKSESFARTILLMGIEESLSILCCREHLNSIEQSVYKTFRALINEYELPYRVMSHKIVSTVNNTEITFGGLSEMGIDAIKSMTAIDVCWVEEAHFLSKRSIEILTPTIRKVNSEIWFSFNRQSENDPVYKEFCEVERESCYVRKVNYDENPFFADTPLENERKEDLTRLSSDDYNHKWLGYPELSSQGSFYAEYIRMLEEQEHVCRSTFNCLYPVYTVWDFGFSDSMAIWFFQVIGKEIRWIEYYEDSKRLLTDYIEEIKVKGRENYYRYAGHFVPHDATKRDDRYKLDRVEIARENGLDFEVVPVEPIQIGIDRCRNNMYRCYFDARNAADGLRFLRNYKRRFNKMSNMFMDEPLHDESSHCADAFRYGIKAIVQMIQPRKEESVEDTYFQQNYNPPSFNPVTGQIL